MPIKSAGTYMQISDLCSSCSKQNFCGNGMTDYYCTGYAPQVETVSDIKVPPFTDGEKEVVEATKRIANGKLICDVDDDIDVLTNEEWLEQASTEEKAKVLYNFFMARTFCHICPENNVCDIGYKCKYGNGEVEDFIKWLKQPHTDRE